MKVPHALIIILLVANLTATLWFGLNRPVIDQPGQTEITAKHDLPKAITSQVRDKLFNDFMIAFNTADYEALYNMFGPAAKAQFSKEDAQREFKKLVTYFNSVTEGAYAYSEFQTAQGNTRLYTLFYAVKLSEKSSFGTKGDLKITIAVQGDQFQVYGIRLHSE